MKAFETTAIVERRNRLRLDRPIAPAAGCHVRVIVLVPDDDADDEQTWLEAASRSDAYSFLGDEAEDVCTMKDGGAFHDQG